MSADWSIPYPTHLDESRVPEILRPLTHVEHSWDVFPWYLTSRLVGLLEKPEPCFEYLHVTMYFRARAAMLALTGDVLDRKELFASFCRHRVQVGGIYRAHLLHYLRVYLKRRNFVQLPECEQAEFDPLLDPQQVEASRESIRRVVTFSEAECINTLNIISLATDMTEVICLRPLESWAEGAERPVSVRVPSQTCPHEVGHELAPVRDEAREALRARRSVRKISVRSHRERGISDLTGQKAEGSGAGWKVVGDYRMIMVPGQSKAINLARKPKARAVLRLIHTRLVESGKKDFLTEEMRDAFNAQFSEDVAQRRWMSDRIREDLFRGKEREFDLLFETLDKAAGWYRMRA